jgi:PPM family protein phosphatase
MQNHEQSTTTPDEPRIEVAVATLAGGRARNADAHLVDQAAGFFAVADGMQDLPRSREVALAALRTVDETFQAPWVLLPYAERTTEEAGERLFHGIARAHVQLFERSAPPKERIGTTFAGIVVCRGGRIVMAHVGSSRVYLLRRERRVLDRLTQDHTLLAASQLWGVPCGETATGRDARTLTQAIGATRKVDPSPAMASWEPGDIAMLCTDGVCDPVEPEELGALLLRRGALDDIAQRVVQRARDCGGCDDATAVLVRRVS